MTAILGSAAFVAGLVMGWPVPYALAVVAVVAVILRSQYWAVLAVVVACATAGELRGTDALNVVRPTGSEVGPYEGTILTYARRTERRQNLQIETTAGFHLCIQTDLALQLGRGDVVRVDGELRPLHSYAPSRRAALQALGCVGTIDGADINVLRQGDGYRRRIENVRRDIAEWFADQAPGNRGHLLSGLVIGDDDALDPRTTARFRNLGMTHITAVSGSNLALLTWLLIRSGTKRRPVLIDVATLGVLWLYVTLAGAGPSTIRAGLTATLCVVVVRTGRRPDLLTIACLIAAAQLAHDPGLIGNLAYRLSTIAMLVMISTLTGIKGEGWRDKLRALIACSIAIQVGTLPFLPLEDQDRNQAVVAGIIANCLAAPMVGFAFATAFLAALVRPISEALASSVVVVAELPTWLVLEIVERMDGSAVARWRPELLGWMPLLLLRATLIGLVAIAFGRHTRRGIRDVVRTLREIDVEERAVWGSVAAGAALGLVGVLLSR